MIGVLRGSRRSRRVKVWEKVSLKSSLGLASLEQRRVSAAAAGDEAWTAAREDSASFQKSSSSPSIKQNEYKCYRVAKVPLRVSEVSVKGKL